MKGKAQKQNETKIHPRAEPCLRRLGKDSGYKRTTWLDTSCSTCSWSVLSRTRRVSNQGFAAIGKGSLRTRLFAPGFENTVLEAVERSTNDDYWTPGSLIGFVINFGRLYKWRFVHLRLSLNSLAEVD